MDRVMLINLESATEPCESCGAQDSVDNEVTLGLDPYFGVTHGDNKLTWLCDRCLDRIEAAIEAERIRAEKCECE